jgi:nitrogen regulatory protein PII-like uncharacterized protein
MEYNILMGQNAFHIHKLMNDAALTGWRLNSFIVYSPEMFYAVMEREDPERAYAKLSDKIANTMGRGKF